LGGCRLAEGPPAVHRSRNRACDWRSARNRLDSRVIGAKVTRLVRNLRDPVIIEMGREAAGAAAAGERAPPRQDLLSQAPPLPRQKQKVAHAMGCALLRPPHGERELV